MNFLKLNWMDGRSWVKVFLTLGILMAFFYGNVSLADSGGCISAPADNTLGSVANNVSTSLVPVFKTMLGIILVAGIVMVPMGVFKIKAHTTSPQNPLSHGIVLICLGFLLLFVANIVQVGGTTLFGSSVGKTPPINLCNIVKSVQ